MRRPFEINPCFAGGPSTVGSPWLQAWSAGDPPADSRPIPYLRVRTARFRPGNRVAQISQTVPSQPRAVQCSRP